MRDVKGLPKEKITGTVYGYENGLTYFGFSQKGEKNEDSKDRFAVKIADGFVITATAKGEEEGELSDYGAYIAVNTAVSVLERMIKVKGIDTDNIKSILKDTMQSAYRNVNTFAGRYGKDILSLRTTLTFTVYDGNTLYFGQAGDDGIIACTSEGGLKLIREIKSGESEFLQDTESWRFGKYEKVTAFISATKGILETFVKDGKVYYRFIKPAVESKTGSEEDVQRVCFQYYNVLESGACRKKVNEDITLIAVTNQLRSAEAKFPKDERKSVEYADKNKTSVYQPAKKKTTTENLYTPQQSSAKTQSIPPSSPKKQDSGIIYCPFCGLRQAKAEICLNCKKPLTKEVKKAVSEKTPSQKPKRKTVKKRKKNISPIPVLPKKKPLFQKSKSPKTSSEPKEPLSVRIIAGIITALRTEPDDE